MTDITFDDPLIDKWERFFPNTGEELLGLLEQRGMTKKIQLQKMLDYVHTNDCRRDFLVSYFAETLTSKNDCCCDNDGAQLQLHPFERAEIEEKIPWQKIVQKIFKNPLKD